MATRLIIDGNSVYEIDETCEKGWQSSNRERKPGWKTEQTPERMLREKGRRDDRKEGG